MGTNYYAIKKKPRILKVYDSIHIGKSSAGWKFLFKENDEYHNFEEFKKWITTQNDYIFKDEYNQEIKSTELLKLIEKLQQENNKDDFTYDKNINGYRFYDKDFS